MLSNAFVPPVEQRTTRRVGASIALLPDGRVLVCGGTDASKKGNATYDSAEILDAALTKWTLATPMESKRMYVDLPF